MKVVNHALPSIDGKGLMMGKPAYTDDLAEPNSLIVKVLRSPHPFAKIVKIDTSKALALDGVELVLTHKDFDRRPFTRAGQGYPEPSPHDKFVLDEYVRYIGDEAACVAAVDVKIAEKALKLIEIEYEVLEPVLDFETAFENDILVHPEPEIHDMFPIGFDPKKNLAASYHMHVGDVTKSLLESEVVIEQSFYTQAQAHVMLEPHTVNARVDYQGRLVIYSSTQTPIHVRRIISQALDYPLSKIRVIKPMAFYQNKTKTIIEHGETWMNRFKWLINEDKVEARRILLPVEGPKMKGQLNKAFKEVINEIKTLDVNVIDFSEKERILNFAV